MVWSLTAPRTQRTDRLTLSVSSIAREAADILRFEFALADGGQLPAFTAGAHIDIHLPNGLVRQYSGCALASERHRYVVAVLKETSSRGGSEAMHNLKQGDRQSRSPRLEQFPARRT